MVNLVASVIGYQQFPVNADVTESASTYVAKRAFAVDE
jgi:hypothetical protein